MSSIYTKILSLNDLAEIQKLVEERTRFLNQHNSHESDLAYIRGIESLLRNHTQSFQLMGAFQSDTKNLVCFAGAYEHTSTPTWSLLYVNNTINELGANNPLNILLESFLNYFESKGIYRFIYACPFRGKSVYQRDNFNSLLTRLCPSLNRYHFFTSEVIEPNGRSNYEIHRLLLGPISSKSKMVVRHAELDEKYRSNLD